MPIEQTYPHPDALPVIQVELADVTESDNREILAIPVTFRGVVGGGGTACSITLSVHAPTKELIAKIRGLAHTQGMEAILLMRGDFTAEVPPTIRCFECQRSVQLKPQFAQLKIILCCQHEPVS